MELKLNHIYQGDALMVLRRLPDQSVNCIVTSPPYWGLRDYGVAGQMGMESTPEEYIDSMVAVFREAKRVLRDDGTLWLNVGDSYASKSRGYRSAEKTGKQAYLSTGTYGAILKREKVVSGLKAKDLVGIPWMLAFALRSDGWYLRSDIIWAKKNCMPESVTDRPTKSHEYIFLLTKSEKYYYDHESIKEPAIYDVDGTGTAARKARQKDENKSIPTSLNAGIKKGGGAGFKDAKKMDGKHSDKQRGHSRRHAGFNDRWDMLSKDEQCTGMRNKRDVWFISPAQFPEAHFATFPEKLVVDPIKAGCPEGGIVLDPFMGAGTTALVAAKLGRNYVGIEMNPEYRDMAEKRLKKELGMFYQK